jgi:hypothetical protein
VGRSFQLALSRADTLDETLGIEIIIYSVALVLCKIGDVFITLLLGFFVYFSMRKLVNKADSRAARPHLSPALHDFSSVLSLAYSLTIDAGLAGERVATAVDLGSLSTAIADRVSHKSSASPPPFDSLFASSGKTSFSTGRGISVSNIGQVQAEMKPKRSKLQIEMHVHEGKSFLALVNGDISETLDYPDSKLATPDVDLTSRPLLPPKYTSSVSSPSTIENEEYFRVAATEISNNVGNDSVESLSVGKLASTTSTPTSSNRFRFRNGDKSMLRSRVSPAYIKSSLLKDRRRLNIQSTYGRQRPASPILTRISASASQPSTTHYDIEA